MKKHPMQDVAMAPDRLVRFVHNPIVRALLDHGKKTGLGLNELGKRFPVEEYQEDQEQFAQLCGYSLRGFSELRCASDEACEEAELRADEIEATP